MGQMLRKLAFIAALSMATAAFSQVTSSPYAFDPPGASRAKAKPKKPGAKPLVPEIKAIDIKVGDVGYIVDTGICMDHQKDTIQNLWTVTQVIDKTNMLARIYEKRGDLTVWFSGISTAGFTDGSNQRVGQILQVTGTKQYTTAIGGTKTVFVISPFAIQDPDEFAAKAKGADSASKQSARKVADAPKWKTEYREWKDKTGNFSVKAKYSGIVAGKVVLLTEDGRKLSLAKEQLSDEDRKLFE
jgi:hypothetical protein